MVLVVVLPITALVVWLVLFFTPVFQIRQLQVGPTVHVSSNEISELAAIPRGSTLFGFNEDQAIGRLKENPWIASVTFTRVFPDTLYVDVAERTAAAVVVLGSTQGAWLMATDGTWLEPADLTSVTRSGTETTDVLAKRLAVEQGMYCITGVDAKVVAEAGVAVTDAAILGVLSYREGFSAELAEQIAFATATKKDSISVTLQSGIEISLGAPIDIAAKEEVLLALLRQYAGQISYINVRTPSAPTFRGLLDGEELGLNLYGEDQLVTDPGVAGAPLPYESDPAAQQATQAAAAAAQQAVQASSAQPGTAEGAQTQDAQQAEPQGQTSSVPSDAAYNGGYYLDDGVTWVNYYYGTDGQLIHGYWDEEDNFIDMG